MVLKAPHSMGIPPGGDAGGMQREQDAGLPHSLRKCLFQHCLSSEVLSGSAAEGVFALSSCFPTAHRRFWGAPTLGKGSPWQEHPNGSRMRVDWGRKAGGIPLP